MYLNIWDSFLEFLGDVKEFFIANSRNPFLWVAIILLGLLVFELTFRSLHKD